MTTRRNHLLITLAALVALSAAFLGSSPALGDDHVSICPHKLVLNAEGKSDDVQAIVRMVLPSARIIEFNAVLRFGGVDVATAESAFYCAIDDNLIVGFDRQELQNNPAVVAMANTSVVATVEGWVVVASDEDPYTRNFVGTDQVEIVKPGRK